jgi:hypothetical protein
VFGIDDIRLVQIATLQTLPCSPKETWTRKWDPIFGCSKPGGAERWQFLRCYPGFLPRARCSHPKSTPGTRHVLCDSITERALMPIYQDVAMPSFDSANKLVTMARVLRRRFTRWMRVRSEPMIFPTIRGSAAQGGHRQPQDAGAKLIFVMDRCGQVRRGFWPSFAEIGSHYGCRI